MLRPSPKHRFYVAPDQVADGRVRFTPEQSRQLRSVLRLGEGDRVVAFDGAGPGGLVVQLAASTAGVVEGQVVGEVPLAREPRTRLVAYPALTSRDKFEAMLQKLVEVGVSAIVPTRTEHALVRQSPDTAREARWRLILREAAEQSGRPMVPELLSSQALPDALRTASAAGPALLAYEVAAETQDLVDAMQQVSAARPETVSLFVGPEGGYTPAEVAAARAAGALVVSLGPRTLRTETASPVFAALVLFALGEL